MKNTDPKKDATAPAGGGNDERTASDRHANGVDSDEERGKKKIVAQVFKSNDSFYYCR